MKIQRKCEKLDSSLFVHRYDEIFSYNIPEHGLGQSKLVVQVLDHALGGRDDVKGEVIINLNQFSFRSEPVLTAWYQLNMEVKMAWAKNVSISFTTYMSPYQRHTKRPQLINRRIKHDFQFINIC